MLSLFTSRTAGLAWSHGQVVLACLTHRFRTSRLEHLGIAPLPATPETLTDTVRALVTEANCRGWPGAIALPADQARQATIRMASALPGREREAELQEHLADYLPGLDSLHYCIDHTLLRRGRTEDQVLVVAAPEDTVCDAVAIAEKAGLVIRIVELDEHAIARAHAHAPLSTLACHPDIDPRLPDTPGPAVLTAVGLGLRRCPAW